MPAPNSDSSRDDYFNDLSRTVPSADRTSQSPQDGADNSHGPEGGEGGVPRPKRIACILCRKRKLKCDGSKPSCGTCSRLGHDCAYDEVRKKSGPKRGYVKLLEARLKQVETMLGTQGPTETPQTSSTTMPDLQQPAPFHDSTDMPLPDISTAMPSTTNQGYSDPPLGTLDNNFGLNTNDDFPWELIGLGVEEPLPSQEIIEELTQIYFEKIHPFVPMIHRPRFLAAMDLAPHMRPPICLRYAMWTHACAITTKYDSFHEHFYARSRKYAELDELKGHGENMITLAHAQTWSLLGAYEFKMMYFPRAWMSCGRATRLCQMMGLHRQDGSGLDVKQCLSPPRDWTEREERRRTFWQAFCHDRSASIGTGWPMTFDERDIMTNLPASEEAFNKSIPEQTLTLVDALTADGASTLSPYAGVVLVTCLLGRNLTHLHQPGPEDRDHDLNGEFWKRHRAMDNILLNTSLSLPSHLRLPAGLSDPNIVFLNMNLHTSAICLHQAAIYKADKHRMPGQISAESKRRCIIAADQIANIMKMISHIDLSTMNPFLTFCLYVASRVFLQYLKSRKDDVTVQSSLSFLLSAMQALKTKNPLTESFIVQLEIDLEGSGVTMPSTSVKFGVPPGSGKRGLAEIPVNFDAVKCSPMMNIRETQSQTYNTPPAPRPAPSADNPTTSTMAQSGAYQPTPLSGLPSRTRGSTQTVVGDMNYANGNLMYGDVQNAAMDLSPDLSASEQHLSRGNSGHPTPSNSSNKGSSHTSFTPPQFDDTSQQSYSSTTTMSPNTAVNNFFNNPDSFSQFATGVPAARKEGQEGMANSFSYPANWDYSADAPANSGTGMRDGDPANLAPGPTGNTPLPMSDASWQAFGSLEGNEWVFQNWNGASPQQ